MRVFSCVKCGCKRFWRRLIMEQIIDWSRESAIPGHPCREGERPLSYFPIVFVCAECETQVDEKTAAEMEEQVL